MGESDVYMAFIKLAKEKTKLLGLFSFIVPDTWLTLHNCENLRKEILSTYFLKLLVRLNEMVFFDPMVDPLIFLIQKTVSKYDTSIILCPKNIKIDWMFEKGLPTSFTMPQQYWIQQFKHTINLSSVTESKLISFKSINSKPLLELIEFKAGCKPYEVGKGNPPQTQKNVDNKIYTTSNINCPKGWLPLRRGNDIGRYEIKPEKPEWINYGEWLAAPREFRIFH